jgi:hypothetical protein
MKDTLQSPASPGDHCFRYRLFTCELVPSMMAGMGTEVVESEHVCIALDGDFLPVPSAEVAIERVFSGRDALGMQWLMLNEKK